MGSPLRALLHQLGESCGDRGEDPSLPPSPLCGENLEEGLRGSLRKLAQVPEADSPDGALLPI